jgi:chemotaxis protein methyltransferase CheR
MHVNPASLNMLSSLLEARTGQRLSTGRHWRVEMALKPILKARGIASCDELVARLAEPGSAALCNETIDALLNNETYFFRDSEAFADLFKVIENIAVNRQGTKRIRIWSAGCSTGQEIYSLAMHFRDNAARWRGWSIELLGTDVSRTAINRAQIGDYSQFEIQRGLPARLMLRWFEQSGSHWRIDESIRKMVRFRCQNILDVPPPGQFDIVLCRNVLLYFPAINRSSALQNIATTLAPDGGLILGAGETVLGYTDRFRILPGVRSLYQLALLEPRQISSVA